MAVASRRLGDVSSPMRLAMTVHWAPSGEEIDGGPDRTKSSASDAKSRFWSSHVSRGDSGGADPQLAKPIELWTRSP